MKTAPPSERSVQGGTPVNEYLFLHRDYLGSIVAITDVNGTIKEKRHFDAWGNVAKLQNGSGATLSSFIYADRGYTGHEHLASVGLIHMNGRLYDPVLHRFLMPDNYVQDPYNTQNFNRYGYVLNNPMIASDPSGEIAWFIPVIVGAVVGAYTGASIQSGTAAFWNWKPDAWQGAITGAFIGAGAGAFVATGIGATGIKAASGGVTKAWGITTSAVNGANINMASSAINDGGWDELWKAGLVGAASGAFTATGGFGLAKRGFAGRLGYQMIGTAGRSIGSNWARGENPLSKVTVGVGPINLTFGKGQKLLQWQNNIGNITMNAFGLANLTFGGKAEFNWEHLTPVYKGGIIDKIYSPLKGESGFSPYVVTGNSNVTNANILSHELHHVWQSRALGDSYAFNFITQGLLGFTISGLQTTWKDLNGLSYENSSFVSPNNYFEHIPYLSPWW